MSLVLLRLLFCMRRLLHGIWVQLTTKFGPSKSKCQVPIENNYGPSTLQPFGRKCNSPHPLPFDSIPAARGIPILGTFLDLLAAGAAPRLHKYIDNRHRELGIIFRERLAGAEDAVFVASASLMRSVFLYEGHYPKHPLPPAWTLYSREQRCERGLFFMDGAEWLHNRRILNRCLLNGNLDWINAHVEECSDRLIDAWRAQASQSGSGYTVVKNLEQQLFSWSVQVICSIMFGSMAYNTPEIDSAMDEFSQIVHKIFQSSALLMNFPPKLARALNLRLWTDFERNVSHVLGKGAQIIDMYVALNLNDSSGLQPISYCQERLFDKLQEAGMPLDMIKRIFIDLVIAAGDTTAYSAEWTLYVLSQDLELQRRIATEASQCRDYKDTVRGLIKETLRLYPVAPFIGRVLASDAVLGDYKIKKGALVLLSLYTAGRDPGHFPQPLIVKPDRWKRDENTGELSDVLQAHGSMPFAIGNRSCIGRKVALKQLDALIIAISRNFELKCVNDKHIDSILRLVTVPDEALKLALKLRTDNF